MELDDLKSAWKSVPEEHKYNKKDIFEMMKKKSSSTIKWLFTFTLIEFIIVLLFTTITLIKGQILTTYSSINHINTYNNFITGSVISIIITLVFLYIIFKNYKKINVNTSVINLTNQIIKFRRMVNIFIFITIASLIIISIPYYYNLGQELYFAKFSESYDQNKASTIGLIAVIIAIVFLLIISSLYYFIIYFFFLRKLTKNLTHLKKNI